MTTISKWLLCGLVLVPLTLVISRAGQNDGDSRQRVANADGKRAAVEANDAAAGSAAVNSTPVENYQTAYSEIVRQAEERIRSGLQVEVTLEFRDAPLNEALKKVADRGMIPLLIDETALSEEGIATNETVTGRYAKLTVEQVIDRLLKPLELTRIIENEVIVITTFVAADEKTVWREYKVKQLLNRKEQAQRNAGEIENPTSVAFNPSNDMATGEWLIKALQKHSSALWESLDGTGGMLNLVGDRLVVRHNHQVQDEVAAMLTAFEQFVDDRLQNGSTAARRPGYPFATDLAIQQALLNKTTVDLEDTALTSVVGALQKEIGHTIILEETPLAEEGIAVDEPISLALKEITFKSLLTFILEPLGCVFYVEDGAVWITTEVAQEENLFVTVYDVRDVLKTKSGNREFIEYLRKSTTGFWKDTDGSGGTIDLPLPGMLVCRQAHNVQAEIAFSLHDLRKRLAEVPLSKRTQPDPNRIVVQFYPTIDRERALDLEKAIAAFVAPDTWQSKSGGATIHVVGETLVIRHTAAVHKQIRNFLDDLSAAEDSDESSSPQSRRSRGGTPPF